MLSDEQIWQLASQEGDTHDDSFIFNRDGRWSVLSFARAIESALSQSTEQGERDAATDAANKALDELADEAYGNGNSREWVEPRLAMIRAAMSPHGDGVNYTRAGGGEDGNAGVKGGGDAGQ